MTLEELVQEIKDDLSASCALPYSLNDQEFIRIITRAKAWMYDNYQYAVEKRYLFWVELFSKRHNSETPVRFSFRIKS